MKESAIFHPKVLVDIFINNNQILTELDDIKIVDNFFTKECLDILKTRMLYGKYFDDKYQTMPVFLLSGVLLGLLVGFYGLYKTIYPSKDRKNKNL